MLIVLIHYQLNLQEFHKMMANSPILLQDLTTGNSSKTFTVPSSFIYDILYCNIAYTSSGTVGNRQIAIQILDTSNNIVFTVNAGLTQAANLTYNYNFAEGLNKETSLVTGTVNVPMPEEFVALTGYTVKVFDTAAIAPTTDNLLVNMMVRQVRRF